MERCEAKLACEGDNSVMDANATIEACGGLKRCGGDNPLFRAVIHDVGVVWREGNMRQPLRCKLVGGKFLRGDKAQAVLHGIGEWAVKEED